MYGMAERELCTGCGACAAVCKERAITMKMDREGFRYPKINAALCIQCRQCGAVCVRRDGGGDSLSRTCWGARAKEPETRLLGSSGGILPLLADQVIQEGGVVFGAVLQKNGDVTHMGIHRREDIPLMTRTKYVQSELSQVWREIGPLLQEGRKVLFCGTPCQAAALRTYLGENRRGLILVDLICYGVPSPGIWRRYVRFLEKRYRGPFRSFAFRDKRGGDNGHTAVAEVGEETIVYSLYQDRFCRSYFKNINIRPSCFHCRYCTTQRASDITLGDFWGIERVKPEFDDGMGNSAVICHTAQGQRLWEAVRDKTQWFSCDEGDIANSSQPRLREPTEPSPRRGWYMGLYGRIPFRLWLRLFKT